MLSGEQRGIQWRKSLLVMNGTSYIPVPKQWIDTNRLKKGDQFIVEAFPDELRIRPEKKKDVE